MSIAETATAFFLAAVVILVACRLVAYAVSRLDQPPVVGEMIAGVLLGPSALGLASPALQEALFPPSIRPMLYVVSHIGLVAFMFGVGYEFRSRSVAGLARSAGIISLAGITVPLSLGIGLVFLMQNQTDAFVDSTPIGVSALFVGVTLSITAFPMLARIITERRLTGTRLGTLTLAAGALDDGLAWVLLAAVLSAASGDLSTVAITAGGAVLFIVLLGTVGKRALGWSLSRPSLGLEQGILITAIALFVAAWFTDKIGLYSVFGGFCLGFFFPRTESSERVIQAITPVTRIVFLPLFFAYSGLNTEFGSLFTPALLGLTGACVAAAVIGKFGACWAAARFAGEPAAVAVRVGALMNARGLMQLIALNVGLQAGIVTTQLFSALVVVAMVTTIMATPCLNWLDRRDARRAAQGDTMSDRVPEPHG